MGWDGMGWTEVTRKKDGPDRFCWSRDSRKYPPDPPRDDRTTERPTEHGAFRRATVGRSDGRADGSIDLGADYTRRRDELGRRTEGKARKRDD